MWGDRECMERKGGRRSGTGNSVIKRALRAAFDTFTALNTFCVPHFFDIHFAVAQALAAVITFLFIDTHAEEGEFVK